jgi:hypothetical protein
VRLKDDCDSPLRVKVGIRDSWDNDNAPVRKAIRNLKEVIGLRVTVNPEWPLLHAELGSFYPDKATLVPSIAAAVEACCNALSTLADDEVNAGWADTLLEQSSSHIRISVEVRFLNLTSRLIARCILIVMIMVGFQKPRNRYLLVKAG